MATELAAGLAARDAVETTVRPPGRMPLASAWSWLWPKRAALVVVLAVWQAVVWTGWKPDYVLPGPGPVFLRLAQDVGNANFDLGVAITLRRALIGYADAVAIGTAGGSFRGRVCGPGAAIGAG